MGIKAIGHFWWNKLHAKTFILWNKFKDSFNYIEGQMEKPFIYFNTNISEALLNSVLSKDLLQHYRLDVKIFNIIQLEAMIWFLEKVIADGIPISISAIEWYSVEDWIPEYHTLLNLIRKTYNPYSVLKSSINVKDNKLLLKRIDMIEYISEISDPLTLI